MNEDRGRLSYQGMKGNMADTIKGQKEIVIVYFFLSCIFLFLFVLSFFTVSKLLGSIKLARIVSFCLFLIFLWVVFAAGGLEIDGIYENGISVRKASMMDRLKERTFHRYENIVKVFYGVTKTVDGETNYLRFIVPYLPERKMYYVCENLYKNDFYERLWDALAENCPNAEWVEVNEV